ncbi:MAG: hypothetical protein ACF8QF_10125 [Phycisphaerales bacterium]
MHNDRRQLRALVALNACLLIAAAGVALAPGALAQRADAPNRGRGEYTMIDARIQGLSSAGVLILDARNREMLALSWDQSRKTLDTLGYRDIDLDERRARGGGR